MTKYTNEKICDMNTNTWIVKLLFNKYSLAKNYSVHFILVLDNFFCLLELLLDCLIIKQNSVKLKQSLVFCNWIPYTNRHMLNFKHLLMCLPEVRRNLNALPFITQTAQPPYWELTTWKCRICYFTMKIRRKILM